MLWGIIYQSAIGICFWQHRQQPDGCAAGAKSPRASMFRAAFTSLSSTCPQPEHSQIFDSCGGFPFTAPHAAQVRDVYAGLTSTNCRPAHSALFASCCLSMPHVCANTSRFSPRLCAPPAPVMFGIRNPSMAIHPYRRTKSRRYAMTRIAVVDSVPALFPCKGRDRLASPIAALLAPADDALQSAFTSAIHHTPLDRATITERHAFVDAHVDADSFVVMWQRHDLLGIDQLKIFCIGAGIEHISAKKSSNRRIGRVRA